MAIHPQSNHFHYSAIELLATLLLLFVASPFVEALPYGELIESVLLTLVMVSAVLATGGKRWTLVIALALVTPALAGKWLHHLAYMSVLVSRLVAVYSTQNSLDQTDAATVNTDQQANKQT